MYNVLWHFFVDNKRLSQIPDDVLFYVIKSWRNVQLGTDH